MTADSQGKSKFEREFLGLENADDSHLLQETQGLVPKQKGWKQRTFKGVRRSPQNHWEEGVSLSLRLETFGLRDAKPHALGGGW